MELCELAQAPSPPYSVVKDIFAYIDIKQDGAIDLDEWIQTFSKQEVCRDSPPLWHWLYASVLGGRDFLAQLYALFEAQASQQ